MPGGQAEYLRVPQAQYGPIPVSPDGPDERYLFLSDILPTAWQAVQHANVPAGGTLVVFGLGPVGQFATRIGRHLGHRVIGIDPVPERRTLAAAHGIEIVRLPTPTASSNTRPTVVSRWSCSPKRWSKCLGFRGSPARILTFPCWEWKRSRSRPRRRSGRR